MALKTDNPDNFGLLLLKTLGYSETLYVTDDQWTSRNGPFAMTESHLSYRNGIVDVPEGTVLQLRNFTGTLAADSDLGDQLLAYVGNTSYPTFLCGIDNTADRWFVPMINQCLESCNYASDGSCDDGGPGFDRSDCSLGTDCTDCGNRTQASPPADRSFLPTTLVDGYSAVAFGHYDNVAYTGTNSGTVGQLRAAITIASNWATSNSVGNAASNVMTYFEIQPNPPSSPPTPPAPPAPPSPPPPPPPSPPPLPPPRHRPRRRPHRRRRTAARPRLLSTTAPLPSSTTARASSAGAGTRASPSTTRWPRTTTAAALLPSPAA